MNLIEKMSRPGNDEREEKGRMALAEAQRWNRQARHYLQRADHGIPLYQARRMSAPALLQAIEAKKKEAA